MASCDSAGTVRVWDAASGLEMLTLKGLTRPVDSVAFSPDGTRLAAAGWDRTVKLWDVASGQELRTLNARSAPTLGVTSVAFSPDGTWLASAVSRTAKVWDTASGQELRTLEAGTGSILGVAFSLDGMQLASASNDTTVKVWDLASGQELRTVMGHVHFLQDFKTAAFSADRTRLASAGYPGSVTIWDLASGHELQTLTSNDVQCVAFSPDGRRLASGSYGGTVKLWDLASGQEVRALNGHTEDVRSVVFSPDGWRLASASSDMTVRVWDARPLTPDMQVQREAVSLLEFLFTNRILGKAELLEKLGSNQTISEAVRQKAFLLADAYWKNAVHQQASRLVEALSAELMFKRDVLQTLRTNHAIMEAVRQEALALAESWPQDEWVLYRGIRAKLMKPGAEASSYRLALHQAEEACRLDAENRGFQFLLAMAQYRLGQYQQALDTVAHTKAGSQNYEYLAILVMANYRLGNTEQAQEFMNGMRQTVQYTGWEGNEDEQALMREAEALLQTPTEKPKK